MAFNPERAVQLLAEVYRQATLDLLLHTEDLLETGRSTAHARAALREITTILTELNQVSDAWIQDNIPAAYRVGWDEAFSAQIYKTPAGIQAQVPYASYAQINRQAVEVVAFNLRDSLQMATQQVGRQAQDLYRKAGLEATQQKLISGESVRKAQKGMKEGLLRQGVTGFRDSLNRQWTLDSYCQMVARTTTREAVTQGSINRGLAGGYDLILISEHHPTCELCAAIQGKVFSLTGNTPGYPRYNDYIPRHPHCRHNISIYQPQFDSRAEERKAYSNTSLTADPRPKAEQIAYKASQDANRQRRDLREQYIRYRERMGDEVGSIQNFAQSKYAESERWKELQETYRQVGREI